MCSSTALHNVSLLCRVLLFYIQPDDGYGDWPLHWTFPQLSMLRQVALCTLHSMAPSFPEVNLTPHPRQHNSVPHSAPTPSLALSLSTSFQLACNACLVHSHSLAVCLHENIFSDGDRGKSCYQQCQQPYHKARRREGLLHV